MSDHPDMRNDLGPLSCPCGGKHLKTMFTYDAPLKVEVKLRLEESAVYSREYRKCGLCGHFASFHSMDLSSLYEGDYVDGTYGDSEGLKKTFDKIVNLPAGLSDNSGRVQCIDTYATKYFGSKCHGRLLDVGAGLGVFPYAMKQLGWDCLALDPDQRAVEHIQKYVGVEAIQGDFLKINIGAYGNFSVVTFNKVLEHVSEPFEMLIRARSALTADGLLYVEVPDVAAAKEGKHREEFTVDHHHVFSPASLAMLCERSGFEVLELERLVEPSGKFTMRVFCALGANQP